MNDVMKNVIESLMSANQFTKEVKIEKNLKEIEKEVESDFKYLTDLDINSNLYLYNRFIPIYNSGEHNFENEESRSLRDIVVKTTASVSKNSVALLDRLNVCIYKNNRLEKHTNLVSSIKDDIIRNILLCSEVRTKMLDTCKRV